MPHDSSTNVPIYEQIAAMDKQVSSFFLNFLTKNLNFLHLKKRMGRKGKEMGSLMWYQEE